MTGRAKQEVDARDHVFDEDFESDITSDNLKPDLQIVEGAHALKFADEMVFMEEKVQIVVHESNDPNAENPIQVSVNGRVQFIWRGEEIWVRRKYVERLSRARSTSYKQDLTNAEPTQYNVLHGRTALVYPFAVRQDSPAGQKWLRNLLAEPA